MHRRNLIIAAAAFPVLAQAHHGWSSFDSETPVFLEGRVTKSTWKNPHAELMIALPPELKLPADLASRATPAQTAGIDGKAILAKTKLPPRKLKEWELELAPLTRLELWKLAEIKAGTAVSAVGYILKDPKGEAVMRVEYLWVDGKAYALRSSPVSS